MGYIVDLSHHQPPAKINYDVFAKNIDHAIIRTQYGSATIDKYYRTHHAELRKRGVPTAAYAWVRGISIKDMEQEAIDFYNRTKDLNPTFWWLDVEEQSMKDMRAGVKAYVKKLRELGARKVGVYIAHHLYKPFNLDMIDFDAVWIPRYGTNNGQPQVKPDYPCDLWQYTSVGKLSGYSGNLDLSKIISSKPLSFFTVASITTETKTNQKTLYRVQSGGYATKTAAEKAVQLLEKNKIASAKYCTVYQDGNVYRFATGTYSSKSDAEAALAKMKQLKILTVGYIVEA
ncbi:GH25 family lysozyme [Ureibacillus thermophilus]|uniref:GH25 family lysozyme n=1 Tax=Ureibacillus thermophilus TaxID=367743 RepID=UPI001ABF9F8C|nr:GH25 family lysozyme [Ureibacillus thermophilus]